MNKITLPLLLVAFTASANAQVIFNDTFSSGTAADAGYYRFGTTNTTLAADNANSELDYSYAAGATARSGLIKSFTEQTLAIGDSITLSFTINSRALASENYSFRWAIGNLGNPTAVTGVPVTADLASASPFTGGTRQMYQFSASSSATAGFGQFSTGATSPVHNTGATAITGFTGPVSIATSGASSVSLTITRTGTSDFSFDQTAFGQSDTGTLTGLGTNIFNNLAISFNNGGAYNVALDNIQVAVVPVPEPSTWALLACGLTVCTLFRRRRQEESFRLL